MKPSTLKKVLKPLLEARHPLMLVGAPGVGKSDIVSQVSRELGADLIVSHPVISDPTDFKGFPFVVDGEAKFLPFSDLRRLVEAKRPTVFLMDDLGQAPASVQAPAMQLLLARRIGDHPVSDHVRFVACTNRREDKAGVQGVLEPVKSRFISILNVDVDVDDWIAWAMTHDMPEELMAFIRWRPNMLFDFRPSKDMVNSPVPRTVASAGMVIRAGIPEETLYETIAGAAGEAFAAEFLGYMRVYEHLPDPDAVLADPAGAPVPDDPAIMYALCIALASRVGGDNADNFVAYAERITPEFAILMMKDALSRHEELAGTDAFRQWSVRHADILL
jgi:hypothetical protein